MQLFNAQHCRLLRMDLSECVPHCMVVPVSSFVPQVTIYKEVRIGDASLRNLKKRHAPVLGVGNNRLVLVRIDLKIGPIGMIHIKILNTMLFCTWGVRFSFMNTLKTYITWSQSGQSLVSSASMTRALS